LIANGWCERAGVMPQSRCARFVRAARPPHRPDCFLIASDSPLKWKGDTMKRKLVTISLLMSALVLPVIGHTAGDSDSDRSSPKAYVRDTEITTKVKAQMAMDKHVSALHIKVDTDNRGVVTLSGKAKSQEEADKAVSIARSVEGVVAVENNIQVVSNR
jgi:hyperosmotically inducible periplasmic protein